ncbi:MAG: sulfatase-like hydrolase/transferase [Lautropia sp.]
MMPLPATAAPDAPRERHVDWLWRERADGAARLDSPRLFATTAREIREIIALTYGMITNIDDRIGLVMQTLAECGADGDTVVIFTSDHGDLMGDHGLMLKGPLHYQGLIRVPLIWREPRSASAAAANAGTVRADLASSIDLAPSILQRARIRPPYGTQGLPLFETDGCPRASGRAAVVVEECQQRAYLGFEQPVQVRTLVTGRHRLSMFLEGEWGELYDLEQDPDETHNLWDVAEARELRNRLTEQLARELIGYAETAPRPTRLA